MLRRISDFCSCACLLHCILFPVIISVLPAFAFFLEVSVVEKWLLSVGIIASLVSLCWGIRQHRQYWTLLFWAGSILWLLASSVQRNHFWPMVISIACLVTANAVNNKLCKNCKSCS